MNQYELSILYDPDLEVDFEGAENRLKKLVASNGGKVTDQDNWGRRKLAYKIKGHDSALYAFYNVELGADGVKPLNDALNISGEVIRFLMVKPDLKRKAKAEAELAVKAKRNAKASENETEVATDQEQE